MPLEDIKELQHNDNNSNANNNNTNIDSQLLEARNGIMKHKRTFQGIYDCCETVEKVNQKNRVALGREVLRLMPQGSCEIGNVVRAVMRLVVRIDLRTWVPQEINYLIPQFDRACLKSIDTFKRNDQSSLVWWEASREWASLVIPRAAVEKCMQEKSEWSKVEVELNSVCSSSESGQRLFGRALHQLDMGKTTVKIEKVVNVLAGRNLTVVILQQNRAAFLNEMKLLDIDPGKSIQKKRLGVVPRCAVRAECDQCVGGAQLSHRSPAPHRRCRQWPRGCFVE